MVSGYRGNDINQFSLELRLSCRAPFNNVALLVRHSLSFPVRSRRVMASLLVPEGRAIIHLHSLTLPV